MKNNKKEIKASLLNIEQQINKLKIEKDNLQKLIESKEVKVPANVLNNLKKEFKEILDSKLKCKLVVNIDFNLKNNICNVDGLTNIADLYWGGMITEDLYAYDILKQNKEFQKFDKNINEKITAFENKVYDIEDKYGVELTVEDIK